MSVSMVVRSMQQQFKEESQKVNKLGEPTTSNSELPQLSVSSYTMPVNGISSVMFQVISSNPSPLDVSVAAGKLFNNELQVIPGTVKVVRSGFNIHSMCAKVCANNIKVSIPDSTKTPAGFRSISRNLFMDDRDESTWSMVDNTDGSRTLVRNNKVETDSDLETLLSTQSSVTHHFTDDNRFLQSQSAGFKQAAHLGQPVSYVNYQKQNTFGFIVEPDHNGKIGILANGSRTPEYVSRCSIVKSFDEQQMASQVTIPDLGISVSGVSSAPGIDTIIAFYRKIYSSNPEYFAKLENQLRSYDFAQ